MTRERPTVSSAGKWLHGGFSLAGRAALGSLLASTRADRSVRVKAAELLMGFHLLRGEPEGVLRVFEQLQPALAGGQPSGETVRLLLHALTARGDYSEAIRMGEEALRCFPEEVELGMALAAACLKAGREERGLELLNAPLRKASLAPLAKIRPEEPLTIRNVRAQADRSALGPEDATLTVLMPAFNCRITIESAVRSILAQTWDRLELIIVDDCSTDGTWDVIQTLPAVDPRVRVFRNGVNSGAYVSRNAGLARATGRFVTCHDTDDWSHPQKMELQMRDLMASGALANTTGGLRVTDILAPTFTPASSRSFVENMSSLLVGRERLSALGGWDGVRFSADGELYHRLGVCHGETPRKLHPRVPLTLIHVSASSLSGEAATGLSSLRFGARWEYRDAYRHWHAEESAKDSPDFAISNGRRPFQIPILMRGAGTTPRSLSWVLVSDFREPTLLDWNLSFIERKAVPGVDFALFHWPRLANAQEPVDPAVRKLVNRAGGAFLVPGDQVATDLLFASDPEALLHLPDRIPRLSARNVMASVRVLDFVRAPGRLRRLRQNLQAAFGVPPELVTRRNLLLQRVS